MGEAKRRGGVVRPSNDEEAIARRIHRMLVVVANGNETLMDGTTEPIKRRSRRATSSTRYGGTTRKS